MVRAFVPERRRKLLVLFSSVLLVFLAFFSLSCGQWKLSAETVFHALSGGICDPGVQSVVRDLRLPRTLLAILSGSALGIAGTILQKILRNDLASPDLLGISAGGGAAGLALLLFFPSAVSLLGITVFTGALFAAMLIYLAAWKRGIAPERLLLAGVSLSALAGSFSGLLLLLFSDRLTGIFDFTLGGFSGKSWQEVFLFFPLFALTFLFAALWRKKIQLLSLGDETAAMLGISVERTRIAAIALAAMGAAGAAGAAGMLGFAGLIAPHTARLLGRGGNGDYLLAESALIGAILVLSGDIAGRMTGGAREIPAGLFLTAAGALFFLILLLRERRRP